MIENDRDVARHVENLCYSILKNQILSLRTYYTGNCASSYLFDKPVDLCLLDLDVCRDNPIDLLKTVVSGVFHTIVISDNKEWARVAYEYGVVDFITKPVDPERMQLSFKRYFDCNSDDREFSTKYLSIRSGDVRKIISVDDIVYFKSAGIYVDAKLKGGGTEILEKSLENLDQILPPRFRRTHLSFLVDINQIAKFQNRKSRACKLVTRTGEILPISRRMYKELAN